MFFVLKNLSLGRDSNPRPRPYQGRAIPSLAIEAPRALALAIRRSFRLEWMNNWNGNLGNRYSYDMTEKWKTFHKIKTFIDIKNFNFIQYISVLFKSIEILRY